MRIIAYQTKIKDNQLVIRESTGDSVKTTKLDNIMSFLMEPYEDTVRVFWDLDLGVAPLLRLFGRTICERLSNNHRAFIRPYSIFYIPRKVFTLKYPSKRLRYSFYHLSQFFDGFPDPKNLMEVQFYGEMLRDSLKRMGMRPTKLISPAGIYKECVMSHLDLPTLWDG